MQAQADSDLFRETINGSMIGVVVREEGGPGEIATGALENQGFAS